MADSTESTAAQAAVAAIVEALGPSPGQRVLLGSDALGEAVRPGIIALGAVECASGQVPDAMLLCGPDADLHAALDRCRAGGTVVWCGPGSVVDVDLYTDVHREGMQLVFLPPPDPIDA